VQEALAAAAEGLSAAGIEEAQFDAEVLLEHASGWDRARLAAEPDAELPAAVSRIFGEMVRRRLRREPVAYIVGAKWFRNIELAVDPRVLIPRPETELLVELALELRPGRALDVGTGAGAIALAIADELPDCEVTATDTSPAALQVARANAERLGLAERVRLVEGSVPEGECFNLVTANLPYVAEGDWELLQPEVTLWEPREALLAGPEGLDVIRAVLPACIDCLAGADDQGAKAGGTLALEVGEGQAEEVAGLLSTAGLADIETRQDLAGIERVVIARKGGEALSLTTGLPKRLKLANGAGAARAALERCIGAGGVAVFPSDGVYGLACDPLDAAAIGRIHRLKGRDEGRSSAVMYLSPPAMREILSDLGPRTRAALGALLPGPVTLIVSNPSRRYPLACREDPARLGVRLIDGPLAGAMCPLFQTSANRSGEPAPRRFEDVPAEIVAGADLAIDGGELIGRPSTVVDLSDLDRNGEWRVLREGALPLSQLRAALEGV
jgi:release factor glutamine methyltransferase